MIEWYVARGLAKEGPFPDHQFRRLVEEGVISPNDLVWHTGSREWVPAYKVPGLLAPPPLPPDPGSDLPPHTSSVRSAAGPEDVTPEVSASHARGPTAPPKRSYVSRHWSGDLSLGLSYWINGTLLTTAVSIVFAIAATAITPYANPVWIWIYVVGIWTIFLLVTAWQVVGIWRAAGKHQGRGGRAFWAGAAKVMVILGLLGGASAFLTKGVPQINELTKLALGKDPFGKYEIRLLRDGTELEVSGPITFGLTDDVRRILDASSQVTVIHLNSIGGRVGEARKLRDLIRERSLITYTATGCTSACTIAFLGGRKRLIASEARLGFHQYAFPGMDPSDMAGEYIVDKKNMIAAGVLPAFADRAFSTPNSEMWHPTAQELLEAGVVTGFASKADFAMSGVAGYRDRSNIESMLAKIPLYGVIKQFDPEAYETIVRDVERLVREGRTEAELIEQIRQHVSKITQKYLPIAADESVLEMTQILISQLKILGTKDPDLCYRFLFPQGGPPLDLQRLLPKELQDAELRALSQLIESGASQPRLIPAEREVTRSLEAIFESLSRVHGDDVALLDDLSAPGIDTRKACALTISMYREVLKLPRPQNVRVLRYMFAAK